MDDHGPVSYDWRVASQSNRRPIDAPPSSAPSIAVALAGWADSGHGNLAQRLAVGLRRLIAAGLVPSGTRLPPERRFAGELAVSRSTVTAAIDLLRADGLVTSRQGRGTMVVGPPGVDISSNRMADHLVAGAGGIDLAVGNPADVSHLPAVSVDIADLLASGAGAGFQPLGLPAMRHALADHHRGLGQHTDPDEIHVTSGAHQAIALLIGTLAARGDDVAIETPGYPGMFDITDGIGVGVADLESDRAGIRPESLQRVLVERAPKVVYVQSGPQNPTGVVTPIGRVRALAAILDRHGAPCGTTVVEDATLAELAFAGRPSTDLARTCRRTPVVSVSSFSKVLWGGLRVGWIRAPLPIIDRTLHRRLASDLGPAVPSQLLCLALLPHLVETAARRRDFLEDSVHRATEMLRSEVPVWEVDPPQGGSVLWVDTGLDDTAPLVRFAHRHGVHVASGSIALPGQRPDPHLRICVDRPWTLVDVGLRRLGAAWRELSLRPARAAG